MSGRCYTPPLHKLPHSSGDTNLLSKHGQSKYEHDQNNYNKRKRTRSMRSTTYEPSPEPRRSRKKSSEKRSHRRSHSKSASRTKKSTRRSDTSKHRRDRESSVTSSSEESSSSLDNRRSRSRSRHAQQKRYRRRRSSSGSIHKRSHDSTNQLLQSLVTAIQGDSSRKSLAVPHGHSMQNIISEFDPKSKTQTMKDWLSKINESAEIYGWSERQTIFYSLPKLTGLARKWYDGLTSVKHSWEQWQQKLLKAFPCEQNYGDLLSEMLSRKSRKGETLIEYYYDKIMLINRCEIKGRHAVDCLTHGIYDNNIRMNVQGAHYDEPEQVLNYLRNISSRNVESFPLRKPTSETRESNDSFKRNFSSTNNTFNRRGHQVTCFNCGEAGHIVSNCPKEIIKCKNCNRHGHVESKCSVSNRQGNNFKQTDATKKVLNIKDNADANSKYYKDIKVNGFEMKAYIDFGSECTLISQEQCCSRKWQPTLDNLPTLKGFGNSTIVPSGKVEINISVDCVDVDLIAYVVPANFLPADILIGQTLTELPSVRVFKSDTELILYQIKPNKNNTVTMKLTQKSIIKGDTVVKVTASSNYNGFLSVSTEMSREYGKDYLILPGLYSFKDGQGDIVIIGLTDDEFTLPKDKVVSRGTSVPTLMIPISKIDESYVVNVRKICSEVNSIAEPDINTDASLDKGVKGDLVSLLNKRRSCFSFTVSELGKTSVTEMRIKLHDTTPVTYRPYRLSISEREKLNRIISELLENEIIRESDSDYASPIILVAKKNGESRLCVDYRALNRKTVKDKYPMPLIDDQIDRLQGHEFFTTLDLSQGYHQIPMAEESKHLTGFVTPDGHFEYNRMPFGLTNAPAVFQRMVHNLLSKRKIPGVVAYMDDIVLGSKSIGEGLEKLDQVLDLLQEANLTLNLKKCHFFKRNIEYLGFEISGEGVRPGSRKTEAVVSFPTPRSVHEVRQFIGLASFFRRFVKDFATIARPMTMLTKTNVKWCWEKEQKDAFAKIKEILTSRPVLTIYNPEHQTELHTDASQIGIGGVLLQREDEKGPLKVVAYFSRQTTTEERHLHSFELETLAVVMSLNRFRVYLLGIQFKVVTDCNALRTTLTKRDLVPRIARWWLLVQDYDFTVEYRPGAQMMHADSLSRNPIPEEDPVDLTVLSITQDCTSLLAVQLSDPRLTHIKCILDKNCQEAKDVRNNYVLKDGKIYRKVGTELKWAVPRDARWKVCQLCHDESGHFAFEKTLEKMRRDYWFPRMTQFVKKYVRACIPCGYAKQPAGKKEGFLHPITKPNVPFECIHIDHLGPFVRSKGGNTYVLGIIDAFTKFIVLRAVRNTKTRTSLQVLREFFALFGTPKVLVSDRGTSFTSEEFKRFVESTKIRHVKNAVATPRANGQIERYNRSILGSLTALNIDKDDRNWDTELEKVQWSLNNTLNKSIGKTPVQVVFGKETVNLSEVHLHDISENMNLNENLSEVRQEATTSLEKQQKTMKTQFDKSRCAAQVYKLGDLVMVMKAVRNVGDSNKLVPPYSGPFKITAILGNDRYEVSSIDGFSKRKYKNVYSADKLKPWIRINSTNIDSDNDDEDYSQSD